MAAPFTPQDPDFERRVQASFDAQPLMATLGAEITHIGPGRVDIEFAHQEQFTQQHGFTHAGIVAAVLDSACGYAAFSLMSADAAVLTVEYKINLLRPALAKRYLASAHVVKPGRTLSVCQATATPAAGGEAIAIMTGTLMALSGTDIEH
ncbi:MAG: PaaI family thioesterase [Acidimicrobiales bacterium]